MQPLHELPCNFCSRCLDPKDSGLAIDDTRFSFCTVNRASYCSQPHLHAFPAQPDPFSELVSLARLVRGAKPDGDKLVSEASADSLREMIIETIHSPSLQGRFLKAVRQ